MSTVTDFPVPPMAVGFYEDAAGQRQPLPFSLIETDRSRKAITRIMNTFHFRTGGNILLTALFNDAAHLTAAERAIMSYGMVAANADSSLFDAKRVESIVRRFNLAAAMAISADTLDGLTGLGFDPAQLFAGMPVWARPGAYERLAANPDLKVFRICAVGPALAMECAQGNGAHIDRFEWDVQEEDGEVVLSSRLDRCVPFHQYRTGIKARVVHSACTCGNADPRLVFAG
jgi:hypothetical protein